MCDEIQGSRNGCSGSADRAGIGSLDIGMHANNSDRVCLDMARDYISEAEDDELHQDVFESKDDVLLLKIFPFSYF